MTIMLPISTTFVAWANDLNRSLPMLSIPIPTKGVDNWWEWANSLIGINHLYNMPSGSKSMFPHNEDWKKWAFLFVQSVQTMKLTT